MNVAPIATVAAFAAMTALAIGGGPADAFAVYHYDSVVEGSAFREVFLVHTVHRDVAVEHVVILRDGAPIDVTWNDDDGVVSVGDSFAFVQEAFDTKHVLTAEFDGERVMSCRFGGGAGLPIHPDEWRAMGHPEQIRCLQFTDDQ